MQSIGCNRWCSTDTVQWLSTAMLCCTGVLQGLYSCAANWWRVSTILPSTYYSIGHKKKHLNFTSSNSTTSLVIYDILIVLKNSKFSANVSEIYKYFTSCLTKPATVKWKEVSSYISANYRWIIFPSRRNYSNTGAAANNMRVGTASFSVLLSNYMYQRLITRRRSHASTERTYH